MKREVWGQITMLELKQKWKKKQTVFANNLYYVSLDVFVYEV